jgi:hypothetical protein
MMYLTHGSKVNDSLTNAGRVSPKAWRRTIAAEQIQDSKANIKVEKQPNGRVRVVIGGLSIAGNGMDLKVCCNT